MSSNNGPTNPYVTPPAGVPTVVETAERQEVVIVRPDGTTIPIGGMEERVEINLVTGGKKLERAQLLYQTDDGRVIMNPGQEGGELYSCAVCKRTISSASARFCMCQAVVCLSCAKRFTDGVKNIYLCPKCSRRYWFTRVKEWLLSFR